MGKTTLAQELGQHWRYVTDEAAGIDDDGRLLPYPKPLSVEDAQDTRSSGRLRPSDLAPVQALSTPVAVVLLDRRDDQREPQVDRLPTVRAVAHLAEHTSYLARLERPLHRLAAAAPRTAVALRASYTEASQLRTVVAELLGGAA